MKLSKLEDALQEAEGDNIAEAAYDKGKELAKDKVKKEGKKAAQKGAKKAWSGAKSTIKSISKNGLGSTIKSGAKAAISGARNAVKGAAAFVKSGPVGWVVGGIAVIAISSMMSSSRGDIGVLDEPSEVFPDSIDNIGVDGGLGMEEEVAAILGEICPPADYGDYSADSGTPGELEDPNSTYYKNARQTFDIWVNGGLSGAAAAGIVGWTMGEGDFHMIGRAEGHYHSNDPLKASVRYGNEPIPSGDYAVGGGGIYQFTPYTKYAPLGDESWEDIIAMHEHMFNIMADNGTWQDWIPSMDYTGGNHSFRQFAEHSDPKMTVLMWNAYERMSDAVFQKHNLRPKKEADAQMIYDLFGGADHSFDAEKFEANFGSGASGNVDGSGKGINDPCIVVGGSPWGGVGGQPSITGGIFAYNLVPDELKKYALDLESLPLRYGQAEDWKWNTSTDHMQCVDLSANLMMLIWEKDGKPFSNTRNMGDGGQVVGNYVDRFGGDSSKEPSAGAVFSTTAGSTQRSDGSYYGHTGVVSHVFDNGDFLIIEENSSISGTGVGPNTYNYRYVQRGAIASSGYTFYDPTTAGYQLVSGLKSL